MHDPFFFMLPLAFVIGSIGLLLAGIAMVINAIKGKSV